MSASSRAPPSEMRTYLRPIARAIDFAIDVLPTPGGPAKRRMRPRARAERRSSSLPAPGCGSPSTIAFSSATPSRLLAGLLRELVHGEELEHAVLHVLEAVVILVEDARGLGDVELLVGARAPRQLRDGLEVGADDLRLHRLAADARQARPLAVDFLARLVGQRERVELVAQLLERLVAVSSPSPSSFWIAFICSRR